MDAASSLDPAHEGRVLVIDGRDVLRLERDLTAPPTRVWSALTSPEDTGRWSFRATFEGHAGGTVTFDDGEAGTATGVVTAWEEPVALAYEWGEGTMPWRVRMTLAPAGDGTRLTFDYLAPDPHHPDYAAGWHWHLDRLAQVIAGDEPARVDSDAHFEELQRLYARAEG